MLGLILAFALTGYLLPWDQKGYWATKVATSIIGATPVIGGWLQELVQGGNEYGNLTLTRFFALHVFVLPARILGLVAIHLALFRKHGVTPRWGRSREELAADARSRSGPISCARDMVAIVVVFAVMFWVDLRASHGVELDAPADPASGFDARPEWYFLPLFQLLKYFHGTAERIVALGAPAVVGGILLVLPFIDRGSEPRAEPPRRAALRHRRHLRRRRGAHEPGDAVRRCRRSSPEAAAGRRGAGGEGAQARAPRRPARRRHAGLRERAVLPRAQASSPTAAAAATSGSRARAPSSSPATTAAPGSPRTSTSPTVPRFFGVTKGIHKMKPTKYEGADLDAVVEMVYAETGAADLRPELVAKGAPALRQGSLLGLPFARGGGDR